MLRQCLRHQWRSAPGRGPPVVRCASLHTFVENDYVVLQPTNRTERSIFVGPLRPGRRIETHKGYIPHEDIIDKSARSVIVTQSAKSSRFQQYRLQTATLDNYVRLTRRLVTPIYPSDANLIVDLFDLHPESFDVTSESNKEPVITILEAGTGHGALTLYLSRAIHAANGPRPKRREDEDSETSTEAWKQSRRAVIHTVDVSDKYSKHASNIVKGFRHGMYHGNVDFHVSDVSSWVESTFAARDGQAFLTHAFLDLPSAEKHVRLVASALDTDGTLIVFTPSITQITELMLKVKKEDVPLQLEKVVELGVNGGSGGREWDVRPVRPRVTIKALEAGQARDGGSVISDESEDAAGARSDTADPEDSGSEGPKDTRVDYSDGTWSTVCRPKVGDRIVGGGFLAVYKKHQSYPS